MKRLWNCLNKFSFSISSLVIILISVIVGRFKPLFIHLFIAFIHEMGHVTMALLFRKKIKKVLLLPFGLYADIDNLQYSQPLTEGLIMIAGPLTFFFSALLINLAYSFDFLSYHSFIQAKEANLTILIFNLLPIWPLDGSKIIKCIIEYFFPIKTVYQVISILSVISCILLIIYSWNNPQIMILAFLLSSQIELVFSMRLIRIKYLLHRLSFPINLTIKVHKKEDIYWPYVNIYYGFGSLLTEREHIQGLLRPHKKRKKPIK